jgi:exodeoxyribonuclease VII large subunit
LRAACAENWAELIVLIRGGGSQEDLSAFNSREVAQAVFESRPPVLSGIGHEVDTTLADLVADVRAATPTHAAQILWPERRELAQRIDEYDAALHLAVQKRLRAAEQRIADQEGRLRLLAPSGRLEKIETLLGVFARRLIKFMPRYLELKEKAAEAASRNLPGAMLQELDEYKKRLDDYCLRLQCFDPLLPLRRGYVFVNRADGSLLRSSKEAEAGERLNLRMVDGVVPVVVSMEGKLP